jgi:FKBP-type peptidyl-prolyl cis-trans isomerase SlyD
MSQPEIVADGTVVTMHYTLKDPQGEVLDSSSGREPLSYLHGASNIVPGLERQLAGKRVGDTVAAEVPPAEGYGERQGPPQPVERSAFPEGSELAPGMQVVAEGPDGKSFPLWIVEVTDDKVMVDANHPLAGVTLHFDVEITELRAASEQEKAHGHPHGPGGHDH